MNEDKKEKCSCPENICALNGEEADETVNAGANTKIPVPASHKNHYYEARNYFESQKFALQGIQLIVLNERNFRIQLLAAAGAVLLGLFFGISHVDWVALFVVIAIVLVAEAFNSVIEAICDTISHDYRINVKYAKDVSAGAVLVSAVVSLIAGVIIFYPYIWNALGTLIK